MLGKFYVSDSLLFLNIFDRNADLFVVPNEKSSFPGKRPKNPKAKTAVRVTGHPCSTCEHEGIPVNSEMCPYIQLGRCHRHGHGEFKFRLGGSEFLDPKCPVCYSLKTEAQNEGWEML